MKYIKSSNGYYYKEYTNGKKVRISEQVYNSLKGKKPVSKKSVTRKPVGKKPVGKKSVGKKSVGKKSVTRKPVGKKSVGKKSVGKKRIMKGGVPDSAVRQIGIDFLNQLRLDIIENTMPDLLSTDNIAGFDNINIYDYANIWHTCKANYNHEMMYLFLKHVCNEPGSLHIVVDGVRLYMTDRSLLLNHTVRHTPLRGQLTQVYSMYKLQHNVILIQIDTSKIGNIDDMTCIVLNSVLNSLLSPLEQCHIHTYDQYRSEFRDDRPTDPPKENNLLARDLVNVPSRPPPVSDTGMDMLIRTITGVDSCKNIKYSDMPLPVVFPTLIRCIGHGMIQFMRRRAGMIITRSQPFDHTTLLIHNYMESDGLYNLRNLQDRPFFPPDEINELAYNTIQYDVMSVTQFLVMKRNEIEYWGRNGALTRDELMQRTDQYEWDDGGGSNENGSVTDLGGGW